MKLTVVIPAYNEEDNIRDAVVDVSKAYPDAEILVVDDASTDRTYQILMEMNTKNLRVIPNVKNEGNGFSVVRALKAAHGDYILYIDADRQLDINFPGGMGYDIISGWRKSRSDKPFRKFISFCLKLTIKLRYGYWVKDANCPFKIYRKSSLLLLLSKLPRSYVIPIACLEVLARKEKLLVATLPLYHKPYQGIRHGFLQSINKKSLTFIFNAFLEIISL